MRGVYTTVMLGRLEAKVERLKRAVAVQQIVIKWPRRFSRLATVPANRKDASTNLYPI